MRVLLERWVFRAGALFCSFFGKEGRRWRRHKLLRREDGRVPNRSTLGICPTQRWERKTSLKRAGSWRPARPMLKKSNLSRTHYPRGVHTPPRTQHYLENFPANSKSKQMKTQDCTKHSLSRSCIFFHCIATVWFIDHCPWNATMQLAQQKVQLRKAF